MSTEQITEEHVDQAEEVNQVEEVVQQTPADDYVAPAITIRKTYTIGEVSEHISVDIQDVQDFPSTGDLAVILETSLHALAGERNTTVQNQLEFQVQPMPPHIAASLGASIKRLRDTPAAVPTAEQLEEELHRVEEHDQSCGQDHSGWLDHLRDLILAARADKAASDRSKRPACQLCGSRGPAVTSAGEMSGPIEPGIYNALDPNAIVCSNAEQCRKRRQKHAPPAGDDLGDAVQATTGAEGGN